MSTPAALSGTLYCPGEAGGKPAQLEIEGSVLRVRAEGAAHGFPLDRCRYEYGGFQDSVLTLTHEEEGKTWALVAPRAQLRPWLDATGLAAVHEALEGCDARLVGARSRGLVVGAAVLAGCLAFVWLLSLAVDGILWWSLSWIPRSWEASFGAATVGSMFPESSCLKDPEVLGPIQQIVDRLLAEVEADGYEFHVRVAKDADTVNAFAVPGGQMVVLTGLIAKAESPEEVAGVLAHEIQHVLRRHSLRKMMTYVKWQLALALLFGDLQTLAEVMAAHATKLMVLAYDRDMEREADLEGLALLTRARVDPKGMVQFFARLARDQGELAEKLAILSTHPGSGERAAEIERRAAAAQGLPPQPFEIDWKRVQSRLKEADP